jgi:tyrosine-protein kinase Tec
MAGKDGKLESKGGDVIRQGFMIKRSQNKKRFTPVNYKQRWFVLTKHYLIYYDGDGEVSTFEICAIFVQSSMTKSSETPNVNDFR